MYCLVPMQAIPNHSFSCVLPIDGGNTEVTIRLMYNEVAECWMMDLTKDNEVVVASLPMVPAQDILEQLAYLQIGSAWILPKTDVKEQWPSYGTLSSDWYVLWGDTDAG